MKFILLLLLLALPVHADNRTCLAQTLFHEAANQPIKAQFLIANATFNRAADLLVGGYAAPRSIVKLERLNICKTVSMPHQYSWWGYRGRVTDKIAYKRALTLATQLLKPSFYTVGRTRYFNHLRLGKRYKTPVKPIVVAETVVY